MNNRNVRNEKDRYSRVLVGLISSNIWAVDFLSKYSYDANEQNKVHLWRVKTEQGFFLFLQNIWDLV